MEEFKIWRTVRPETYRGIHELHSRLIDDYQLTDKFMTTYNVMDFLEEVKLKDGKESKSITKITLPQLGLGVNSSYSQICNIAVQKGLRLCTVEDVLYLREQYNNQPIGETLYVPVKLSGSNNSVISVFVLSINNDYYYLDCFDPTTSSEYTIEQESILFLI